MRVQASKLAMIAVLSLASAGAVAAAGAPTIVRATAMEERSGAVGGDLVVAAKVAGNLNTFLKVADAAGLTEKLHDGGPYTIFAPTDAAFAALPAEQLDALMRPENRAELLALLDYHMIEGRVIGFALQGQRSVRKTQEGQTLTIEGSDVVTVNGVAMSKTELIAQNGVLHPIDHVLIPPKAA